MLKIKKTTNMFLFSDKTNNIYKMRPKYHEKLIKNSITKAYKKASTKLETSINLGATNIAKKFNLAYCIQHLPSIQQI